jgi:signal transduction histidine kinase
MAERLETARDDLIREADERVGLERRFRESDKLAAVGRLAAGLAHEIATPLQIIKGRTDILERKQASQEVYARNLRIIGEQIDRVTALVRALLDLSRPREMRVGRVGAASLIHEVADLLEAELKRTRIALTVEVDEDVAIEGDRSLLHQVLMNLVLNAVQALGDSEGDRLIAIRGHCSGEDRVTIEVEDTGPGVAPDALDRVFEPFFSTKSESHGTGLGLSIARSIVEEHGGRIAVENVVGPTTGAASRGARFSVQLPSADSGALHG